MILSEMFEETYISGVYEDPHTELSQRLGITREDAKTLADPLLYSYNLGRFGKSTALQRELMQTLSGTLDGRLWFLWETPIKGYEVDSVLFDDEDYLGDPILTPVVVYGDEDSEVGKKGDRVYKAQKPFWDKSKY